MDVFRTYDIRGVYPHEMTDEIAYLVGKSLVVKYKPDVVALGHDHRISSPSLHDSMIRGITDAGADVHDIGFCSSPELYHYNVSKGMLGVMITASHNPREYNGIKVNNYDGTMINYAAGLNEIEKLVEEKDFIESDKQGNVVKVPHTENYVSYLKGFLKPKKMKIVVDTGNGVAGPTIEKIFKGTDVEIIPLYFEPDGNYPNHQANPVEQENIVDLSAKIREVCADFGAAFDGDADRCIFLDERGAPIPSDLFFGVIIEHENKKNPHGTYYFDLWFSRVIREYIDELECMCEVLPLGVANYKKKLVEEGGIAASEVSGHVLFQENNCQDDGFFMLIKAINYYAEANKTFSAMVVPFMSYFQDKFNVDVSNADEALEQVKERYADGTQSELDGVSVEYPDFWFNVRKSNTEPLVRVRIEAETKELLDEKVNELKEFIQ
jgi:phosphomannomutase